MKPLVRSLLAFLVLLALPGMGSAADVLFFKNYNTADAGFNYGLTSPPVALKGFVTTSGSSTTVTAVGTATPFAVVDVGDIIIVNPGPGVADQIRYVTAKASSISITIDTAANWDNSGAGYSARWQDVTFGTAATDGWVSVGSLVDKSVQVEVTTINATSITFSIEGRASPNATASVLLQPVYTAADSDIFQIPERIDAIRVGIKLAGDSGAQVTAARLILGRE